MERIKIRPRVTLNLAREDRLHTRIINGMIYEFLVVTNLATRLTHCIVILDHDVIVHEFTFKGDK